MTPVALDDDVAELLAEHAPRAVLSAGVDLGDWHRNCDMKPGTPEHARWAMQRTQMESYDRRQDGQMAAATDAMREQVAADFGQPGEVVGPGRTLTGIAGVGSFLGVSISACAEQITSAFTEAFESLHSLVTSVDVNYLKGLLDDLATDERETTRQNLLRHGRATTCPKHGPTKGGLCRRCRR